MALKELVSTIAKALADNPSDVSVTEMEGEGSTLLELRVAKNDIGKMIGRDGKTAQSIRTIIAAAAKQGQRAHLDILD